MLFILLVIIGFWISSSAADDQRFPELRRIRGSTPALDGEEFNFPVINLTLIDLLLNKRPTLYRPAFNLSVFSRPVFYRPVTIPPVIISPVVYSSHTVVGSGVGGGSITICVVCCWFKRKRTQEPGPRRLVSIQSSGGTEPDRGSQTIMLEQEAYNYPGMPPICLPWKDTGKEPNHELSSRTADDGDCKVSIAN